MTQTKLLLATAATAIAAAGVVAGCGGTSQNVASGTTTSAASSTTASAGTRVKAATGKPGSCVTVPAALDRAILAHVFLADARLLKMRATRAGATPSYYYVSGAVSGSGVKHLLATWVTSDLAGHKPIYSVDGNAALISAFGPSSGVNLGLAIDAPGAYRSRTCVAGGRATLGVPAPPMSHGGAPSGQ